MIIASDRKLPRVDLPIPSGWFQVLYSNELEVGQAKPLEYFDQELVAFRTESGQAKVVDALLCMYAASLACSNPSSIAVKYRLRICICASKRHNLLWKF